jgi:putative transcription factor
MPKKSSREIYKECPVCGGKIWGKGQYVLLEGAKITVCQSCAQFGKKIQKKSPDLVPRKQSYSKADHSSKRYKSKEVEIENIELIPDYPNIVRNARNSRNLNQEQFAQKLNEKPSLIRRIEAGKVEPTIKLAKKIEQIYNIKLLKKTDEVKLAIKTDKYMKKTKASSLGDIAFIKKRNK